MRKWIIGILFILVAATAYAAQENYSNKRFIATSGKEFLWDISEDNNTSQVIDTAGFSLVGFLLDANFDGTVVTFYCAPTASGTAVVIEDTSSAACTATTAASQMFAPASGDCVIAVSACRYVVLESTTVQATTDTTIYLVGKR